MTKLSVKQYDLAQRRSALDHTIRACQDYMVRSGTCSVPQGWASFYRIRLRNVVEAELRAGLSPNTWGEFRRKWLIYIPEEGHWNIEGRHYNLKQARAAYLRWAGRMRIPAGAFISPDEDIRE